MIFYTAIIWKSSRFQFEQVGYVSIVTCVAGWIEIEIILSVILISFITAI